MQEKSEKSVILGTFRPFRDFFETPGQKAFWRLFGDFFAVFGLGGLQTAVDGRQECKVWYMVGGLLKDDGGVGMPQNMS